MCEPMARAPGYYPDPASNNQIRYWNGTGWDEQHQSATYGTPAAAAVYGAPQPSPHGAPPPNPYGAPPPGLPNVPTPRRGRHGVGWAVALVVLLAIGGGIWALVRNAGTPPEPTGEVQVDTALSGYVPSSGSWASALTIVDAGVYWLSATANEDLTMALYDSDSEVAENDDGGPSTLQASVLDPLLVVYLEPGEYVVAVETYRSETAHAKLRVTSLVDAVEVGSDPVSLTTSSERPWFGYTEDTSGSIGIDVHAALDGDDLEIDAWDAGETSSNDDRGPSDPPGGEFDPYLEIDRPQGRVVFLVEPWGNSADEHEATVTVSATS